MHDIDENGHALPSERASRSRSERGWHRRRDVLCARGPGEIWHHWNVVRAFVLACSIVVVCMSACGFQPAQARDDGGPGSSDAGGLDSRTDGRPAPDAPLGPRFVQAASAYAANWNSGASSIAVTFAQPVAAGNLIAIYVTYATQGGSYMNTTDAQNDTFMPVDTSSDGGQQQAATSIYAANVSGG